MGDGLTAPRAAIAPAIRLPLALCAALVAVSAAGFAIQHGLTADSRQPSLVFSSFNAAHYAFDYSNHGFIKRGLIGTLFAGIDPSQRHAAVLLFNVCVLVGLAALVGGILAACRPRLEAQSFWLLVAMWIAAPPAFINLGYDFGRYDHFNLLLLTACLAALQHQRILLACLFVAAALLIHEAFVFYGLPLIGAWMLGGTPDRRLSRAAGKRRCERGALAATVAVTILALWQWGRYEAGREALVASVAGAIDNPRHNALNVWLRSFDDNLVYVGQRWSQGLFTPADVLLYLVLAAGTLFLLLCVYRSNRSRLDPLFLAPLGVLPLFALGVDYARWLSLLWIVATAVVTLQVLSGTFTRLLPNRAAVACVVLLTAALLLGPIGSVHCFPLLRAYFENGL